jgi:hypothetical protein
MMNEVNRYVVDCNRLWKNGSILAETDIYVVQAFEFDRLFSKFEKVKKACAKEFESVEALSNESMLLKELLSEGKYYGPTAWQKKVSIALGKQTK